MPIVKYNAIKDKIVDLEKIKKLGFISESADILLIQLNKVLKENEKYNDLREENEDYKKTLNDFSKNLSEFSDTEDFLMALIKIEKMLDKYEKV